MWPWYEIKLKLKNNLQLFKMLMKTIRWHQNAYKVGSSKKLNERFQNPYTYSRCKIKNFFINSKDLKWCPNVNSDCDCTIYGQFFLLFLSFFWMFFVTSCYRRYFKSNTHNIKKTERNEKKKPLPGVSILVREKCVCMHTSMCVLQ